jgi:uncharacterized protein involved in exopolysaccharide biosynthesis/Mrp family chromosome partitioning ATPase
MRDRVVREQAIGAETAWRAAGDALPALLRAVRRRPGLLAAVALLVPLLGYVAIRQMTPRYTATATVLYDPPEYTARELQSILRVDPTTDAVMASQAEIVRSLPIAERIAARFALRDDPEFNAALRPPSWPARLAAAAQSWLATVLPDVLGPPGAAPDEAAIGRAVTLATQDALTVKPVRASRVLEVSFTAPDRELAAGAANLAVELYVADQLDKKFAAVRRATDWLGGRAAELRAEVRAAEDRIAAYRAQQGLVQGVQAGLETEQASRLSADLVAARTDLAQARARLEAARGGAVGAEASQAAIAPSVVQARAQQDALAAQLQALLARLGPNHPQVLALREQLAEARRATGAEIARVVAANEADVRAAGAKVASLEAGLRAADARVGRDAQAQVPLNAMERDAEAARALLQAVLERIQQTAQQAAIETPDARLISPALPPPKPSSPRTPLLLAAATAAGLFLGLLLVHGADLLDGAIGTAAEVRASLGVACLGLLPRIRARIGRPEDAIVRRPRSALAEQVRGVRAGLALGANPPRVVAITAARPGEGKTTLAIALGRAAALAGERVIVLDCDTRRPALGRRLGGSGPGLAGCLGGVATAEQCVRTDAATPLEFIPAGTMGADAALPPEAMARLLRALRADYDLVLLDVPPALAVAEARALARAADAVVVCVRWRRTPAPVVRELIDLLEGAQARVAGVAITQVDPRTQRRAGGADAELYHRRYASYFQG